MDQVAWQWNAQVRSYCVWWAWAAKQAPGARKAERGKEGVGRQDVGRPKQSHGKGRTPNEGSDIRREIISEVN